MTDSVSKTFSKSKYMIITMLFNITRCVVASALS